MSNKQIILYYKYNFRTKYYAKKYNVISEVNNEISTNKSL